MASAGAGVVAGAGAGAGVVVGSVAGVVVGYASIEVVVASVAEGTNNEGAAVYEGARVVIGAA